MSGSLGLGIDLGGTKILVGVVGLASGKVHGRVKKRTRAEQGPDEVLDRVIAAVEEALDGLDRETAREVQSIGVAAAGQVDRGSGTLVAAPNLGGRIDMPLGTTLSNRLGLPVTLGNDVQAASLGELRFGAARGNARQLCVFIGTGIGGALIDNGELEPGPTGTAGELGHVVIDAGGRFCGCGGRGHLEAYGSRTAIARVLANEIGRGRPSKLTKLIEDENGDGADIAASIRSGMLARAAAEGDELVLEVLREAAWYLGLGLASAINFYNPLRIVLGGGLIEAMPDYVDLVAPVAKSNSLPAPGADVEIVASALGDDAGIVGAALMGAQVTRP